MKIANRSLLAGVSLGAIALASGAQAADLGPRPVYKAPALAPAPWSWAGFYLGANVGVVRSLSSVGDDDPATCYFCGPGTDANKVGVIGGLQAGYNWQFKSIVLGLEGDISFASLNRSVPYFSDTFNSRLDALGTMRGRIGWAFDRVLVYGTGGVAFASLKNEYVSNFSFTANPSSTTTGWTAGGGVEYAITDHWTAKAEYLHVGFPDRDVSINPFTTYSFAFKDSLDIGRVGVNYKF